MKQARVLTEQEQRRLLAVIADNRLTRDKARAWIDTADFVQVCGYADFDPDMVRKRAKEIIASGLTLPEIIRGYKRAALAELKAKKAPPITPEQRIFNKRFELVVERNLPPDECRRIAGLPDNEWAAWWNENRRDRRRDKSGLSAAERKRQIARDHARRQAERFRMLGKDHPEVVAFRERRIRLQYEYAERKRQRAAAENMVA